MSTQTHWKLAARQDRQAYAPTPEGLVRIWILNARLAREDARLLQGEGCPHSARPERRRALSFYTAAYELARALGIQPGLLSRK